LSFRASAMLLRWKIRTGSIRLFSPRCFIERHEPAPATL
jgi:hypothetical protein